MWICGSEITDHITAYPTPLQQRCCHPGSGKFPALKQVVLKEKEGGGWRRKRTGEREVVRKENEFAKTHLITA